MAGGKVMLTEGIFSLAAAVNVASSGICLSGSGHATILKMASGNNVNTISNTASVTDIVLENFAIDGSTSGGSSSLGNGIGINDATRVAIRHFYVHEAYRTGIEVLNATDVKITGNLIDASGRTQAAPNIGFQQCTNIVVANNICKNGADEGIDCNGATEGLKNSRVTIVGNVIDNATSEGVDSTGLHDTVLIMGNSIFSCADSGIKPGPEHHVIGNMIEDCAVGIDMSSGGDNSVVSNEVRGSTAQGILSNGVDRNLISNNHVLNSTSHGIDVVNSDYNTITGNEVMNNDQGQTGQDGIALRGSSVKNTVTGNNCSDDQGTPTQTYGIRERDTADNNLITGNVVQDNQTAGIIVVGSSTIVRTNPGSTVDDLIADPGASGAIPATHTGHVPLVSASGAETRTLADAAVAGLTLDMYYKTESGTSIAVTAASPINQAGNTIMTFSDVGEHIRLTSIEDGADFEWRVVANDGVALS